MSRHRNIRALNYDDGKLKIILKTNKKLENNFSLFICFDSISLPKLPKTLLNVIELISEYDDFNAVVGSLDEQECISPTDANQYLFDRARGESSLNRFLSNNEDIQEGDEEDLEFDGKERRDSENFQLPELSDIEKARLMSCMEEIRNIIGDSCSDKRIVDAIMINEYDFSKALDMLLNNEITTPQQTKRPKVIEVEKGMFLS